MARAETDGVAASFIANDGRHGDEPSRAIAGAACARATRDSPSPRRRPSRRPTERLRQRRPPRRGCRGRASRQAPAAEEAAPRCSSSLGLVAARVRLLDLRDHDGRRPGPAASSRTAPSTRRAELGRLRPRRRAARDPDRQRAADPASSPTRSRPNMKQAVVAIEDQRFYEHRGVDFQSASAAPSTRTSSPARPARAPRRSPSSSSRTRSRAQNSRTDLPEAARGGARLPARAPVVRRTRSSPST